MALGLNVRRPARHSLLWSGTCVLGALCVLSLACPAAAAAPGAVPTRFLRLNDLPSGEPIKVTYDKRSFFLNGERTLFLSGSVHPPRSTPSMWDGVFKKAVAEGLNMIELYVFWNYHQPTEDQLILGGNANLTHFLEVARANNLFVNLRIGPYVCAEWDYGGIPAWVGEIPGVAFRSYNKPWMDAMAKWFNKVVEIVRDYLPDKGGPILMGQVENELHAGKSTAARQYINWCGDLANKAVDMPWIMCNGDSAPNTINSCNANDCVSFIEEHGQSGQVLITQPAMWTEDEGWFQQWGQAYPDYTGYRSSRTTADLAWGVARWFARGGCYHSYYMWFGGNNYGKWAGSSVATFYADLVNVHSDTLINEPKYSHLKKLHERVAQYSYALTEVAAQAFHPIHLQYYDNTTHSFRNGTQQLAFVYSTEAQGIVFIENQAAVHVTTRYQGKQFDMPPLSVSLIDADSLETVYNSADIEPAKVKRQTTPVSAEPFQWQTWQEPLHYYPPLDMTPNQVIGDRPYEQLNITKDLTQYLYYEANFTVGAAVKGDLVIESRFANGLVAFIDDQFVGKANEHSHAQGNATMSMPDISVAPGGHTLTVLSESIGVNNRMNASSTAKTKGIVGSVVLGSHNLTSGRWRMRPFLAGQVLDVTTAAGSKNVSWSAKGDTKRPLTWFQTTFTTPSIPEGTVLLLDASGMGRGQAYVNGHSLGRYWTILGEGTTTPSQPYYHIPHQDWLEAEGGTNVLTLIEVTGATDPSQVRLVRSTMVPV